MALPTTLTGVAFTPLSSYGGPFISSTGNVYWVGRNSATTTKLAVMKATDPTSSFADQDTANSPTTGAAIQSVSVCQVADVLHIATYSVDSTNELRYHTFNMATDAYVIINEAVADTSVENVAQRICSINVRSDGQPVIVYGGTLDVI